MAVSLPTRLTGNQKRYMQAIVNIVIWFSVFYFAGKLLPGAITYVQSKLGNPPAETESSTTP